MSRSAAAVLAAVASLALAAPSASADHSWGSYHWARTANPFGLAIGDNMTAEYDALLFGVSADWSKSTVLDTTVVPGNARNKQCRPTSGRVEACNGFYGNNGWLGLAQIWISGSHITQGTVKLNDTYLASSRYTATNRRHVLCQEVGHTLGLDHQDESGADLNTCMDYAAALDNPSPNAHDYEQLTAIYRHLDSTTTAEAEAASAPGGRGERRRAGRSLYVEDLGRGRRLYTFVFWVDDRAAQRGLRDDG